LADPVQTDLTRRARNLVEFLTRLVQMRTAITRDVADYEDVVWFADVPELAGSRCVTHPGRAADSEWLALERPRIPARTPWPVPGWTARSGRSTQESR